MYFGMFGAIFLLSQYLQIVPRATRPSRRVCASCPGRWHPSSSHPSRAPRRTASAAACSWASAWRCRPSASPGSAWSSTPDRRLRPARHPVHHLGHRHGPVLRTGRERRAERRPTAGGRPGIGCQQRHPRGRRCVRGGHPGLRVQQLRRLRDAPGVHGRPQAGHPHRRRCSWPLGPWPRSRSRGRSAWPIRSSMSRTASSRSGEAESASVLAS